MKASRRPSPTMKLKIPTLNFFLPASLLNYRFSFLRVLFPFFFTNWMLTLVVVPQTLGSMLTPTYARLRRTRQPTMWCVAFPYTSSHHLPWLLHLSYFLRLLRHISSASFWFFSITLRFPWTYFPYRSWSPSCAERQLRCRLHRMFSSPPSALPDQKKNGLP